MPAKKIAKSRRRVPVTFSLDPELVKSLRRVARRLEMPVSRLVERLLQELEKVVDEKEKA